MRLAHQGSIRETWRRTGAYSVWFLSWYLEAQLQAHRGFALSFQLALWEYGHWRPSLRIQLGWVCFHAHRTYEDTRRVLTHHGSR